MRREVHLRDETFYPLCNLVLDPATLHASDKPELVTCKRCLAVLKARGVALWVATPEVDKDGAD